VSRILRTLIQAGGATIIVQIVLAFWTPTAEQVAAMTGALTWLLAIVQNLVEEKTGTKLLAPSE
jgi:hypothetical protein